MKKIAMIALAIMLIIPEITYCKRITLDGDDYQEDGNGIASATPGTTSPCCFLRNFIQINGKVCEVCILNSFTLDNAKDNLAIICIPSSAQTLSNGCFGNRLNLSIVTFESNSKLTAISDSAFRNCHSLISICLPASLHTIGGRCFAECSKLSNVTFALGTRLTRFSEYTFNQCHSLKSICLPSSLQTISEWCFQACGLGPGLSNVINVTFAFGSQLTIMGDSAFCDCALESICIPASVETIGKWCFRRSSNLSSVTFESESQLTIMGDSAFYDCASLESICIPASVETIGRSCFGFTIFTAGLSSIVFEPSPQPITIEEGAIPAGVTVNANGRPLIFIYEYCTDIRSYTYI